VVTQRLRVQISVVSLWNTNLDEFLDLPLSSVCVVNIALQYKVCVICPKMAENVLRNIVRKPQIYFDLAIHLGSNRNGVFTIRVNANQS